jgi:hypothetical protein
VILIMNNRAGIDALRPEVTSAETRVTQLQKDITTLNTQISSTKGSADALGSTLTTIERGRATIISDLREVTKLAGQSVSLESVSHTGGAVSLNGGAVDVDYIFRYARALRESEELPNELRFSSVWISSIAGGGTAFDFALTK